MSYKDLSIKQYLNHISGLVEMQGIETALNDKDIIEEYLEHKFSNAKSDTVIEQVRDFAKSIAFKYYEADEFSDEFIYRGSYPLSIFCQLRPNKKFEFEANQSLKERINVIENPPSRELPPMWKNELFNFSNIAEEKYIEVCSLSVTKITDIPKKPTNFAECLTHDNKQLLIESIAELVNGQGGIRIAHVLKYLNDKDILKFDEIKNNVLYDFMMEQFNFDTSIESINKYTRYNFDKCTNDHYKIIAEKLSDI